MKLKKNVKPTEQEVALREWLEKNNVTVIINLAGRSRFDDEKWEHDAWSVSVSRPPKPAFNTEFKTGTGNRVLLRGRPSEVIQFPNTLHAEHWMKLNCVPHPPEAANVFHSILLDSEACNESFEDWADNFGMDKDSRRAEKVYEACKEIGFKVRAMFSRAEQEEIRKLLEDY